MGLLAQKTHTAGNRKRWRISYGGFAAGDDMIVTAPLDDGVTVTSVVVALADVTIAPLTGATVDTTSVDPEGHVIFWTNGGVVNEVFTINVSMTDSIGGVRKDTVGFTVVAP